MRLLLLLLLGMLPGKSLRAQLSFPEKVTGSASGIAGFINSQNLNEGEKFSSIYYWIVNHISYDRDSAYSINFSLEKPDMIAAVLRRRRGVCENYAALFNDLVRRCGLQGFVVDGFTKQQGRVDKSAHCWNAVLADNEWMLCDATWGAGSLPSKYFMVRPEEMIQTHFPFDPMWQLLLKPITEKSFISGKIDPRRGMVTFNYRDSIASYSQMDSLEKIEVAAKRIAFQGLANPLAETNIKQHRMNVEMYLEDKDVLDYNAASKILNECKSQYNSYIQFRNSFFLPTIRDPDLAAMLSYLPGEIKKAENILYRIRDTKASYQFDTQELQDQLSSLKTKIKIQQDFVILYLQTALSERESLFYIKK
ncbi:MAG: transglutaminase domain-containing protein [Ferruginibacter sp.]